MTDPLLTLDEATEQAAYSLADWLARVGLSSGLQASDPVPYSGGTLRLVAVELAGEPVQLVRLVNRWSDDCWPFAALRQLTPRHYRMDDMHTDDLGGAGRELLLALVLQAQQRADPERLGRALGPHPRQPGRLDDTPTE